jgi:hypothetical protein
VKQNSSKLPLKNQNWNKAYLYFETCGDVLEEQCKCRMSIQLEFSVNNKLMKSIPNFQHQGQRILQGRSDAHSSFTGATICREENIFT